MTLSRRKSMALIGGGVVLAAGGGTAYEVTRKPDAALAPWARAGSYDDPRMRALSYAILAPNPHNRQPWKVDLSQSDRAVLYVDTDRLLPHTDPFNRQITIGLGCFLEVMRLAALEDGLAVDVDLFPDGSDPEALDARPVALCTFTPTTAPPDPLFAQVPHRRTLKEIYDTSRPVPQDVLARIRRAARHGTDVGVTDDAAQVAALRDLSAEAFLIEFRTKRTLKESVDLFRIGHREVNANPDGIDFSGPMFEMLRLTGLFSREKAMDPEDFSYKSAEDLVVANVMSGMAHLWQVTATNTRQDQIRTGQDWVRINLAATAEGVGLQPLSQGLQEFPEMARIYATLHETLAPDGGTVQMWCRLGYGPEVPVSPRWPLEAKLMNA
ncbi:twin-arginine translocation pathway signal protein [Roseobacter sp. YSTF-M11]|uniref:Twin-arginine translocation pathway signal protein n=1 Tax=Roseobacter insulae TaxID=2859783 RepID=A0A9X1FZ78_9RHOB|nr:twin-arginine translocation pathway signal protein [Roseobacter insulae]MBW4710313.1 twin-arginine translocation pathway signal protein [Roseobacter insulae]